MSFMYFPYVFPLYFPYWSSSRNPMLLILYIGINCITCSLFVFSSNEVIQIYHFLITLSINLFYFLYSYLLLFLKHVVSPILLKLHIIQEAPLPPCNLNRSCHIEDNVQLGWGESWGMKFLLLMLSYFGNLVDFCLILKFFLKKFFILLSMVIKEKFSNWNGRNWIFFFSRDLEFVLCLLKLMN